MPKHTTTLDQGACKTLELCGKETSSLSGN
jgi:hypothetical protein